MHFHLMSDGAGKDAIIIPAGGLASRRPPGAGPVELEKGSDGVLRRPDNLILRGADIFSFAISKVPFSIKSVMEASGKSSHDIDYLVMHQANKMINDTVAKKTGFVPSKVPSSIERYGNTSSASIPVTLCVNADQFDAERSVIVSGFGVGLSWGSAVVTLPAGTVIPCIESDEIY